VDLDAELSYGKKRKKKKSTGEKQKGRSVNHVFGKGGNGGKKKAMVRIRQYWGTTRESDRSTAKGKRNWPSWTLGEKPYKKKKAKTRGRRSEKTPLYPDEGRQAKRAPVYMSQPIPHKRKSVRSAATRN